MYMELPRYCGYWKYTSVLALLKKVAVRQMSVRRMHARLGRPLLRGGSQEAVACRMHEFFSAHRPAVALRQNARARSLCVSGSAPDPVVHAASGGPRACAYPALRSPCEPGITAPARRPFRRCLCFVRSHRATDTQSPFGGSQGGSHSGKPRRRDYLRCHRTRWSSSQKRQWGSCHDQRRTRCGPGGIAQTR